MKNCKVLVNNECVTVFDYDGVHVQVPSIHRDATSVNVIIKNGLHTVVPDDYKEPVEKANKKTTSKKSKAKSE